ncbi:ParA family protein [Xanthomonas euvesicatoria pv. allii]|uniref:ParA family protein n=1 Tax=Xanthomonas euvesicatoria TaxID=456327 RepID=UPI0024073262|nr:ParA family protein [Xanthomonas euvesicatoria]MCP3050715.1 ParA family protein [Xanthomonas euvesicatoria pv. allii]
MKTIVVSNQKGGVGKSAVATQMAYYMADKLGLRTLVVDLDNQRNTTKPLSQSGMVKEAAPASHYFLDKGTALPSSNFTLIPGDDGLAALGKKEAMANTFASNFRSLLARASESYDICIIDTNPFPDIRLTSALVSANFVISPIQLNQEAIDGIGKLRTDIRNIKERLNPELQMIGLVPNLVTPTPFQKSNFAEITKHYGALLIKLKSGGFAHLKERTAVAEAQAAAKPIYSMTKTSAREAWKEWEDLFSHVAAVMGVSKQ